MTTLYVANPHGETFDLDSTSTWVNAPDPLVLPGPDDQIEIFGYGSAFGSLDVQIFELFGTDPSFGAGFGSQPLTITGTINASSGGLVLGTVILDGGILNGGADHALAVETSGFPGDVTTFTVENGGLATAFDIYISTAPGGGTDTSNVIVETGGQLQADGIIVGATDGSIGSLIVDGVGSQVTAATFLSVGGFQSAVGHLTVENGATVNGGAFFSVGNGDATVETGGQLFASQVTVAGGTLTVDGAGSLLQLPQTAPIQQGTIQIGGGDLAATGSMTVANGATVIAGDLHVGNFSFGGPPAAASVTVSGLGTSMTITAPTGNGSIAVGINGAASLTIEDHAVVTANAFSLALNSDATSDSLVVDNATLTVTGNMNLANGGSATALFENGAHVAASTIIIAGPTATSSADVTVTGAGTVLSETNAVSGGISIGRAGAGTLHVTNGAEVDAAFGTSVANVPGASGIMTVDSGGSFHGTTINIGGAALPGGTALISAGLGGLVALTTNINIFSGGTIDVSGGGSVTSGATSAVAGAVHLGGVGGLVGAGLVIGNLVDDSGFRASGGTLKIEGDVTGTGIARINGGATLELAGSDTVNVTFLGQVGTLKLDQASAFSGHLSGLAYGDLIDLTNISVTNVSFDGTALTVTKFGGQQLVYQVTGTQAGDTFLAQSDGAGGTDLLFASMPVNHAPAIDVAHSILAGTVNEQAGLTGSNALDQAVGSIVFTDADSGDRPTASVTAQSVVYHDALGHVDALSAAQVAAVEGAFAIAAESGNSNNGAIDWSFSLADKTFDFLAAGETITLTSTVQIDDHQGGTVAQDVTVTVNGADDAPVTVGDIAGVQKNSSIAVNALHGVLANDSDPDSHDSLSVGSVNGLAANVGHAVAGSYGTLTLNADGSYSYVANSKPGNLPADTVPQDVFTYAADDGHGGITTATLTVTVFGPGQSYFGGTSGADTLIAGNGKSVLDGGAGNDVLVSGNGADWLIGGAGNDVMTGGKGADTFVFNAGFGNDTITDFTASNDEIQIDHALFATFAAVQSHMQQVGANTVITYDAQDTITLMNVAMTSLHAADFHLV